MSMWTGLIGAPVYAAGTSGTVTLPVGASIISIRAHSTAGGTVTIFGGDAIPIVATFDLDLQFNHRLWVLKSGAQTVVFTTTTSYFIEYVKSGF